MTKRAVRLMREHQRIGIDTNVVIYLVQDHPMYGRFCANLFRRLESGRLEGVTATLTLLEVLVQPYRVDDLAIANKFFALFSTYPGLKWVPLTLAIADRAASIRAKYKLSTPDAIHVASAINEGATALIGNDKTLRKVTEVECVMLDELVGEA